MTGQKHVMPIVLRTDVIAFSAAISACVREGAAPWVDDS